MEVGWKFWGGGGGGSQRLKFLWVGGGGGFKLAKVVQKSTTDPVTLTAKNLLLPR